MVSAVLVLLGGCYLSIFCELTMHKKPFGSSWATQKFGANLSGTASPTLLAFRLDFWGV